MIYHHPDGAVVERVERYSEPGSERRPAVSLARRRLGGRWRWTAARRTTTSSHHVAALAVLAGGADAAAQRDRRRVVRTIPRPSAVRVRRRAGRYRGHACALPSSTPPRSGVPGSWPPMGEQAAGLLLRRATFGSAPARRSRRPRRSTAVDKWLRTAAQPRDASPTPTASTPWQLLGRGWQHRRARVLNAAAGTAVDRRLPVRAGGAHRRAARSGLAAPAARADGLPLVEPPQRLALGRRCAPEPAPTTIAVIRAATRSGRFSDLLVAAMTHPAMLQLPQRRQLPGGAESTRTSVVSCSSCTPSASATTPRPTSSRAPWR